MSDKELAEARRLVVGGFVHTRPIEKVVSTIGIENLYPLIIIPDDQHALKPVEPLLGKLVEKR